LKTPSRRSLSVSNMGKNSVIAGRGKWLRLSRFVFVI
jgi:hypothetical protein